MNDVPEHLRDAETPAVASDDQLLRARELAQEYWDVEERISDLELQLSQAKQRRQELQMREIPDFCAQIGMDRIGLPNAGENGADVVVAPYYHANIAGDWTEEERERGFRILEDLEGESLIRVTVSVQFFKDEFDQAMELVEHLRTTWRGANQHPVSLEKKVPWNTLTSFVREYHEDELTPPLSEEQRRALGATIGTVAKIKKRKK